MHSGVNDALHVAARKVVLFFFVEDVSGWQASGTAKFLWPMVLRKNIALLLFTEGMREMTQNEPILVSVKGLRLSALAVERLTNVGQILPIKFRKAVHAAVKELVVRLLDEQDGDWIHAMPLLNWLEDCDESIDRKHLEIACYNFGFVDMNIPPLRKMMDIVQVMSFHIDRSDKVAVHCHAGSVSVLFSLLFRRSCFVTKFHTAQMTLGMDERELPSGVI